MKIDNFFIQNHINLTNKKIIVATSGGPDSMALLDLLNTLKKQRKFDLIVAHFDHQLRSDSKKEDKLISQYCVQHQLPYENGIWPKNEQPSSGVEAAAREARYAFLTEIVNKFHANYLLTAHHGDDLIENILLKFIRSGNPSEMNSLQAVGSMHGIALLRPLLTFSKNDLLTYDQAHGLDYIEDTTNDEDETLRNRLRHHIIPLLKDENPKLIENAIRYCQNEDVIESLVNKQLNTYPMPEYFLGAAYRIKTQLLADLTYDEQIYYWQSFIWQKYHRRAGDNISGYNLSEYQGYQYLWSNKLEQAGQDLLKIKIDQPFIFKKRNFLLSQRKYQEVCIGDFWSTERVGFWYGSLPSGSKLPIKNGKHVKAKKMFAHAAVPQLLRPFCITIFDQDKRPIFIEKTYQDQRWQNNANHYFLYELKKA